MPSNHWSASITCFTWVSGRICFARFTNIGPNGNNITVVAILKKGFKVAEIPVVMRERQGGSSSITLKKSVYYMVKVTLAILFENFRGDKHR